MSTDAVTPFAALVGSGHGAGSDHGAGLHRMRARLGPAPVLVGPSAAWVWGMRPAISGDTVHVAGVSPRRASNLVAHRSPVEPHDLREVEPWGRVASPLLTALDLARGVGTRDMDVDVRVAVIDALLRTSGLAVADARRCAMSESGRHGLLTARRVLALARDGVESPKESELRLALHRHGWRDAVVQCPVRDRADRVIARLDLGWPEWRIGVEYDGAGHRDAARHARDMDRHNAIRLAGWLVIQVGPRLLRRPDLVAGQLASLVVAAGH